MRHMQEEECIVIVNVFLVFLLDPTVLFVFYIQNIRPTETRLFRCKTRSVTKHIAAAAAAAVGPLTTCVVSSTTTV